jgi:ribosomal protein L11 methyltransferase
VVDTYLSLRCLLPTHLEDELPELLRPFPVLGTAVDDPHGELLPVTVYFDNLRAEARQQARDVLERHGGVGFDLGSLAADDWLAAYRAQVEAFAVGNGWWVDPHPEAPTPAPETRRRLVVPPRMAFGSGSHESTRLVLEALEGLELAAKAVLDVGCGSGILALAAERSGAAPVIAVDIDATAVGVAREIATQQEWSVGVHFAVGSADCVTAGASDVVLCNMISEHFTPLLGAMERALSPTGVLVLSGLMASEIDRVTALLAPSSLKIRETRTAGEWASLTAGRRP